MGKPFVYLAGPYTKGDPCINTYFQHQCFNKALDDGIVNLYIPLTSHFLHTGYPRPYKDWLNYDLEILPKFDALLRLDAVVPHMDYVEDRSSGADKEIAEMHRLGKPVFYSWAALYEWATQ